MRGGLATATNVKSSSKHIATISLHGCHCTVVQLFSIFLSISFILYCDRVCVVLDTLHSLDTIVE